MGGKKSRDKGSRVERLLVDTLKKLGWVDVYRVPFSGMMAGFKADVVGHPNQGAPEIKIEVKARRDSFGLIYALADGHNNKRGVGSWDEKAGFFVSYSIGDLIDGAGSKELPFARTYTSKNDQRAIKAVLRMREWLGEASILAIKQDHKPFLYIRYYGD